MKKLSIILITIISLLFVGIVGMFFFNKHQETQLEKEKVALEMEKLKQKSDVNKNSKSSKKSNKEDKSASTKNNTGSEKIIKESVLDENGGWWGDSGSLGFDVHKPSASRTMAIKIPNSTYYVMPEEYERAKGLVYSLNALDKDGKEDCKNINSQCYYEKHLNVHNNEKMTEKEAESIFWDVMDGRNLNPTIDMIVNNEDNFEIFYTKSGSDDGSNIVTIDKSTSKAHGPDIDN